MAVLAVCAVTATHLADRTDTQAPPNTPDQPPPSEAGMIPLTVPEVKRLLDDALHHRVRWRMGSTSATAVGLR